MRTKQLVYRTESFKIVGACMEVYNEQGPGFLESVYQESLEWELKMSGIPFDAQDGFRLSYKGNPLKSKFLPDFICFGKIIVEIKSVSALSDQHRAQVHNYLKATGLELGFLVNFGNYPNLEFERIIRSSERHSRSKRRQID